MNQAFPLLLPALLIHFAISNDLSAEFLVELCDTTKLDPTLLQGAREETSALFAAAEARLRWEGNCNQPPTTTSSSARIYVVPRIPEGIANRYRQYRDKTNVMGYVLADEGKKRASVIYVAREAVEAVASRSGRTSLTEAHRARAMGRVFAHELAHRFLRSGHTKKGILKDSLDSGDLIDEDRTTLFFSPEQMRILRGAPQ